jgi:DNA-binding MarR family transcriptional regulator
VANSEAADFRDALNGMLMSVYHNILRVEERFLRTKSKISLTIREMHLIEYVGEGAQGESDGKTAGEIADYLKVARPTVTVALRKLEQKGYITRGGSEDDGRIVRVALTRQGRKLYLYHKRYHMNMAKQIESEFDGTERALLLRAIEKLNRFFEEGIDADR